MKCFFFISVILLTLDSVLSESRKNYIVVLSENTFPLAGKSGSFSKDEDNGSAFIEKHDAILSSFATKNSQESPTKVYSYFSAINAFSARLTTDQAAQLAKRDDVAGVIRSRKLKKEAVGTYSFLGLDRGGGAWRRTTGTNMIIGVLDDGIWPENQSFDDVGLGPVPKKFRGTCQTGQNFTRRHCNRKIIGARYFSKGYLTNEGLTKFPPGFEDYISPRSAYGHGVHTASIAGGAVVPNVEVGGIKFGPSKGIAYSARLAIYKVCWGDAGSGYCSAVDIVAAIDQAVRDGVDVISASLGSTESSYAKDIMTQVALGAVLAGVPCVFSAGNRGPDFKSVGNTGPWVLSVASSSFDLLYSNSFILNKRTIYSGISITTGFKPSNKSFALVNGYNGNFDSEYCSSLDPARVKNKIVYCRYFDMGSVKYQSESVYEAGGVGMIVSSQLYSSGRESSPQLGFYVIPTSQINATAGDQLEEYIKKSKSPIGQITPFKTLVGAKYVEAPRMAYTSSLGPNPSSLQILKPDVTAPGIDVLAAWSEDPRSPVLPFDNPAKFKFLSGTSMACPHVSGALALVKAFHPTWPPSWLYSAIITTAYNLTNRRKPIMTDNVDRASPINYGAGHLDVNKALFPGLVYGITPRDYDNFLCTPSVGFVNKTCAQKIREIDLNLPSLSLPSLCKTVTVKRRLTLVNRTPSSYKVAVSPPEGTVVTVKPRALTFEKYNQTLEYSITVRPVTPFEKLNLSYLAESFSYGYIVWSDARHSVKLVLAANVPSEC